MKIHYEIIEDAELKTVAGGMQIIYTPDEDKDKDKDRGKHKEKHEIDDDNTWIYSGVVPVF